MLYNIIISYKKTPAPYMEIYNSESTKVTAFSIACRISETSDLVPIEFLYILVENKILLRFSMLKRSVEFMTNEETPY